MIQFDKMFGLVNFNYNAENSWTFMSFACFGKNWYLVLSVVVSVCMSVNVAFTFILNKIYKNCMCIQFWYEMYIYM